MRFGLLGPVLVHDGEALRPIGARRQRSVLAVLLLRPNQVVSGDALADAVWGGTPPESAVATLHSYVMRLRRTLGPQAGGRLRTAAPGYLIEVGPDELDVDRFRRHAGTGRDAAARGDHARAARDLTAALDEWRGDPLLDVQGPPALDEHVGVLTEEWLQVREARIDAELELGRHRETLAEIRQLASAHPLREHLTAQLLTALFRADRQAEALAVYQHARTLLVEHVGVEPGPELQRLHRRILSQELAAPEPAPATAVVGATAAPEPRRPRPAQLPPELADFAGREDQLAAFDRLLPPAATAPLLAKLTGGGGLGKTALAVRLARRAADRYPDGQIFLELHGMAPSRTVRPADAHARLLRDLGLAPHEVPHDPDERASLFRTLCADRRLLFVLDDARDMAQLRPLLPAGAGCGAIVTSRNRLSSLPGAQDLRLAALPRAQARTLFLRIAGIGPREAEPEAVEAILDCCAGLPLALRIAAARATAGPTRSLRVLADRLADRRHGLAELTVDDLAVQTSYQTTVDCLSAPTAAALPALGCWPGTDLPHPAVAALWDLPERATDTALAELTALHLVEPEGPDRVRTHDLIRRCLEETAAEQLTEPERRAARGRVLAWYLDRTEAAAAVLADPDASRHGAALDWCEQELPNLLVAAGLAEEAGRPTAAALLARSLWAFFDVRKHWLAWLELQQLGLAAAERSGDTEARASLLNGRAAALWGLGRFQEAGADWELAAELYLGTEEPGRAADMFGNLSGALARQELFERAVEVGERAVAIHRGQPPRPQHAGTLNNLGMVYFAAGRRDEARRCYQDAVELSRTLGHRHFEAAALSNLAELATACGDPLAGIAYCTSALALCEEIGSRYGRALTLNNLGQARLATGETGLARQAWASALEILEDLGDPHAESVRASLARTAPVPRRGDDPDERGEAGPSTA